MKRLHAGILDTPLAFNPERTRPHNYKLPTHETATSPSKIDLANEIVSSEYEHSQGMLDKNKISNMRSALRKLPGRFPSATRLATL